MRILLNEIMGSVDQIKLATLFQRVLFTKDCQAFLIVNINPILIFQGQAHSNIKGRILALLMFYLLLFERFYVYYSKAIARIFPCTTTVALLNFIKFWIGHNSSCLQTIKTVFYLEKRNTGSSMYLSSVRPWVREAVLTSIIFQSVSHNILQHKIINYQ